MKCFVSLILCLSCFVILLKNPVSVMQRPDFYYSTAVWHGDVLAVQSSELLTKQFAHNCKKACWISYLEFEQYLKDLDEESFRNEVTRMYDVMLSYGLNTAIVQLRAFGDAIYPSNIFPLATYISTDRKALRYDALEIMIQIAHDKGLYFEAWINPYRLSKDSVSTNSYKKTQFYNTNYSVIIEYTNEDNETALSLDPASQKAQDIIIAGIDEIIDNYDVDAIQFDDYFYVEHMADSLSIDEKASNINEMIRNIHEHTYAKNIPFGISPAGNIEYSKSIGADVNTWLSEPGYIDFVIPQLYWSDNYILNDKSVTLFSDRCKQWADINQLDLPIYTGLGLYRVGAEDEYDRGWQNTDTNLKEQYEVAKTFGYDGFCLFRYAWLEKECANIELYNLKQLVEAQTQTEERNEAGDSQDKNNNPKAENIYSLNMSKYTGQILLRLYTTDGKVIVLKHLCCSFLIASDQIKDIQITYINDENEACTVLYRTKRSDGSWNRWVTEGKFSNFEQFCTIIEVNIIRIPRKTVKNTCFFVN